ncbi:hypothetical protein [Photobacterium atrarenae]|uniref:Uncharacterized protein n=1 Tax=Photobacterium atrarenae TaxID=865757 RepID=A0ABY5GIH0_9GAMM|nr:hypothetical protein [Photobacterium atrarenae]UTV28986.1 hypothetical protein NNL38_07085 [Photobacterium atrarenae]
MKVFKKMLVAMAAVVGMLCVALPVSASEAAMSAESSTAWLGRAVAFLGVLTGLIAQVDAHVPEELKRRWPWWFAVGWNYLAGNYKHSKNAGM